MRIRQGNIIYFFLLGIFLTISTSGISQITKEENLKRFISEIKSSTPFSERASLNDSLIVHLKAILLQNPIPAKLNLPSEIGSLIPSDSSFRLILWPLPTGKTTFISCGLLQTIDSIYTLYDSLPMTEDRRGKIFDVGNWPGALYYKIIETKSNSTQIYTLLGWNSADPLWQSKVVDILWFDKHKQPHFGMKKFPNGQSRFILSYARSTTLSLRYERQTYYKKTWWSKNKVARIEPMIVFDRLVSPNSRLKNNPNFNQVAGNIFDALLWQNNMWVLKSDIDSRNPDTGRNEPTSSPKQGLRPPDAK